MLDKNKLIEYLKDTIEACEGVENASDKAIIWQCERILKNIEIGMFDLEK